MAPRSRRFWLLALCLAAWRGPAAAAIVESLEPAGQPAVPSFTPIVMQSMYAQLSAAKPDFGNPAAMAQTLLKEAGTNPGSVAAAVMVKRALSEPEAYASVQRSLAAQPGALPLVIASQLKQAKASIQAAPQAEEAFYKTFAPLERALETQDSFQGAAATLDAFFTGAKAAGREAPGVYADGAATTPKIAAPLTKPGPHHRLNLILSRPDMKPEDLLAELKNDSFLRAEFAKKVGVDEGYSLERHTLMVLGQFEKYFAAGKFSDEDRAFLRVVLALHDIGKPGALEKRNLRLQHEITRDIVARVFPKLGFSAARTRLARALLDGDPVGRFFKLGDAEEAVFKISAMARESGVPAPEFYKLLQAYYMADASSYTLDAGGSYSLDYLFKLDRGRKTMEFEPDAARRLKAVSDRFVR